MTTSVTITNNGPGRVGIYGTSDTISKRKLMWLEPGESTDYSVYDANGIEVLELTAPKPQSNQLTGLAQSGQAAVAEFGYVHGTPVYGVKDPNAGVRVGPHEPPVPPGRRQVG